MTTIGCTIWQTQRLRGWSIQRSQSLACSALQILPLFICHIPTPFQVIFCCLLVYLRFHAKRFTQITLQCKQRFALNIIIDLLAELHDNVMRWNRGRI